MKNFFNNMQNFFGNNGNRDEQSENDVLNGEMSLDDVFNSEDLIAAFAGGPGVSCNGSNFCKDQASW